MVVMPLLFDLGKQHDEYPDLFFIYVILSQVGTSQEAILPDQPRIGRLFRCGVLITHLLLEDRCAPSLCRSAGGLSSVVLWQGSSAAHLALESVVLRHRNHSPGRGPAHYRRECLFRGEMSMPGTFGHQLSIFFPILRKRLSRDSHLGWWFISWQIRLGAGPWFVFREG